MEERSQARSWPIRPRPVLGEASAPSPSTSIGIGLDRQKKPLVHLPVRLLGDLKVQPTDRVREDYGPVRVEFRDKATLPEGDKLIAQLVQVIFGEARKKIH